jgi:hypothetical protein
MWIMAPAAALHFSRILMSTYAFREDFKKGSIRYGDSSGDNLEAQADYVSDHPQMGGGCEKRPLSPDLVQEIFIRIFQPGIRTALTGGSQPPA